MWKDRGYPFPWHLGLPQETVRRVVTYFRDEERVQLKATFTHLDILEERSVFPRQGVDHVSPHELVTEAGTKQKDRSFFLLHEESEAKMA